MKKDALHQEETIGGAKNLTLVTEFLDPRLNSDGLTRSEKSKKGDVSY